MRSDVSAKPRIEDVLNRPKIRRKSGLTDKIVQQMMERLSKGEKVAVEQVKAISRDPKDDIFLACAETGKADYIVSEDGDLPALDPINTIRIVNALDFARVFIRRA